MSRALQAALDAGKSPGEQGFVMPAETAHHACCWMAWAHHDEPDFWDGQLAAVQANQVRLARTIAKFEPVRMLTHPDHAETAQALLGPSVEVVALAQDDLWFRDTGPLFVQDSGGQTIGSTLRFTNWGHKFPLTKGDVGIGTALLAHLGLPHFRSPLVGEGGGLISDGEGTVITTTSCFANANRNPGLSRAEVEQALFHAIGARKVIWLPGDPARWITDGHIDGLLTYVAPGHVLMQENPDPSHPHHAVLEENFAALQDKTDAQGRKLRITRLTEAHQHRVEGRFDTTSISYVNCYIANGAVILPEFGVPETDLPAQKAFAKAFPDRQIVAVDMRDICWNGGGIHCMTQQQPA